MLHVLAPPRDLAPQGENVAWIDNPKLHVQTTMVCPNVVKHH